MRKYRVQSEVLLKPASPEEVSKVLKYCNERCLAIVPQGGNTGLVGGSVPVFDEIVLSTTRLNRIRSFDPTLGVLVADAGVILEYADRYLAEWGHTVPLDLGAKGSCHIGGNVATNAGGLRYLRYGSLNGNVLGLEAVLPDGTILDSLTTLRKNNTGYNHRQLFIGAEGTLGVVTGVVMLCPRRPKAVNVAYLGVRRYEDVCETYRQAKEHLSEILSAFEMMDGNSQQLYGQVTKKSRPLGGDFPFYCLIETHGSDGEHNSEKLETFMQHVLREGTVTDGVLAQDEKQRRGLWEWREGIAEAMSHLGGTYKFVVSIPLPQWYQLAEDCRRHLIDLKLLGPNDSYPVRSVIGYGHVGDANIHLNVCVRRYSSELQETIEPWVYHWVHRNQGSISAEHGIGIAKQAYLHLTQDSRSRDLMRRLKEIYDPVRTLISMTSTLQLSSSDRMGSRIRTSSFDGDL